MRIWNDNRTAKKVLLCAVPFFTALPWLCHDAGRYFFAIAPCNMGRNRNDRNGGIYENCIDWLRCFCGICGGVDCCPHPKSVQDGYGVSRPLLRPTQYFYFRPFRERSDHALTAWRWGLLNAKILDFGVKAGIGGFHPPRKQLTGKACNGVPLSI